jgi:hypothetical protein
MTTTIRVEAMRLTRANVEAVDLEPLRPFAYGEGFFWTKEHYKLLAHLSTRVGGGTLFDLAGGSS